MLGIVLAVFFAVILTLIATVVLHIFGLALFRACGLPAGLTTVFQGVLALCSCGALWWWMEVWIGSRETTRSVPASFEMSALLLYLAGCIVYVEVRSLVSRGYSLRVLIDLLNQGGQASVAALKSDYGQGAGMEGLLRKRLNSMVRFHLVGMEGDQVGPLTPWGRILANMSKGIRMLLRLERVG